VQIHHVDYLKNASFSGRVPRGFRHTWKTSPKAAAHGICVDFWGCLWYDMVINLGEFCIFSIYTGARTPYFCVTVCHSGIGRFTGMAARLCRCCAEHRRDNTTAECKRCKRAVWTADLFHSLSFCRCFCDKPRRGSNGRRGRLFATPASGSLVFGIARREANTPRRCVMQDLFSPCFSCAVKIFQEERYK